MQFFGFRCVWETAWSCQRQSTDHCHSLPRAHESMTEFRLMTLRRVALHCMDAKRSKDVGQCAASPQAWARRNRIHMNPLTGNPSVAPWCFGVPTGDLRLRRSTLAFMAALQHSVLTFMFRCLISCMAFPLDQELQTTGTYSTTHPIQKILELKLHDLKLRFHHLGI